MISNTGEITIPIDGLPIYRQVVPLGGLTGPARVELRGEPNKKVEIRAVSASSTRLGSAGEAKVEIVQVVPDDQIGMRTYPDVIQVRLDRSGYNAITIGGRLTLKPGNYTGVLEVPILVRANYANE